MKLKSTNQVHEVVRRGSDSFTVDGVNVEAAASSRGPSTFEGRVDGRPVSFHVARQGDRVFAQVGGRAYAFSVLARAASLSSSDAASPDGLEAPMPGRVTRVAVAIGDPVKRGQELIVVEAMKMENALVAPSDGVVKTLTVKVGDMVAPGPALIFIEAAK